MLNEKLIVDEEYCESEMSRILIEIHENGPVEENVMETLAVIKHYHPNIFSKYEHTLTYLMGLFYKVKAPANLLEFVYDNYAKSIRETTRCCFTPMQADAYLKMKKYANFSFSAPTSTGKSFLFRELIEKTDGDVIIVVPSRALLAEYIIKLKEIFANDKQVLILPFVEIVNTKHTSRRIFVVTPERATEWFKYINKTNIRLFIFDESQLSEERNIRGMKFDALIHRLDKLFPNIPKVFAHPFVKNPDAQLKKHNIQNASSAVYNQRSVGKLYMLYSEGKFSLFSPFSQSTERSVEYQGDLILDMLEQNKKCLIYVSKSSIYDGGIQRIYEKYINACTLILDPQALALISQLKVFLGVKGNINSTLIEMMKRGVVVHHGSIPLKARYIIEDFVKRGFARLCFSTSTLLQGINMPFDLIWIENFHFSGDDETKPLDLKNLIGRAGRSLKEDDAFNYGYVVIPIQHRKIFEERMKHEVVLSEKSMLDVDSPNHLADFEDEAEAIRDNSFNLDFNLPQVQVDRLKDESIENDLCFVLDGLMPNGVLISAGDYYALEDSVRTGIKTAFRNIYIKHLRRKNLNRDEKSVLSTSIPMLLWKIQGKSFSEVVSIRYSYLSKRDERRRLKKELDNGDIDLSAYTQKIDTLMVKYSPVAFHLPNHNGRSSSAFKDTRAIDLKYDLVIYDTYDYLDKVIALSLRDPLSTAFLLFYHKTQDIRAKIFANYILYGTDDELEIWLLKYGFSFEDMEWLRDCVQSIGEEEIVFNDEIDKYMQDIDKKQLVERYL